MNVLVSCVINEFCTNVVLDAGADNRPTAETGGRRVHVHRGQKSRLQEEISANGRQRTATLHGEGVQLHQRTWQGDTLSLLSLRRSRWCWFSTEGEWVEFNAPSDTTFGHIGGCRQDNNVKRIIIIIIQLHNWHGSVVRTSVSGWRTIPDLWLTCYHFVGKVFNQANSAFHPFGVRVLPLGGWPRNPTTWLWPSSTTVVYAE